MISNKETTEEKREFEPLEIMGIFWLVFGIVVLAATFFVNSTPQVPRIRGIVTNIIAGVLLFGAGLFSYLKARSNKHKKSKSLNQ